MMLKLKVLYRFLFRIVPDILAAVLCIFWVVACLFGVIACMLYFPFILCDPPDLHAVPNWLVYAGGFCAFALITTMAITIKRDSLDPIWSEEERKVIRRENQKDAIGGITEC